MSLNKYIVFIFSVGLLACAPKEEPLPEIPQPSVEKIKSAKRGVSFDFALPEDVFLLRDFVSWSYNWGPSEDDAVAPYMEMTDIAFIPMAWTANFDANRIAQWVTTHPQCKYILGFNEPNLTDQCNMTPRQVADAWPRLKALADSLGVALVSPAMNYGTLPGYSDPIKWLDEFFSYIPLEQSGIKVIAIHCYMNTAAATKSYIERFYKYNLPIWMTEICAWDGGVAGMTGQMDYMADIVTYMELNPKVERYAWFMPRMSSAVDALPYNQLLTHGIPSELTSLGKVYAALPNLEKPFIHNAANPWDLTQFSSCRQKEYLNESGLCVAPHFRESDDPLSAKPLIMYNISQAQWVEYTVVAQEQLTTLIIRYQSSGEPVLTLQVDDGKPYMIVMPTTKEWGNHEVSYPIQQGLHTIRLTMTQGFCNLSTIYWK